jgi:hypothetical protein
VSSRAGESDLCVPLSMLQLCNDRVCTTTGADETLPPLAPGEHASVTNTDAMAVTTTTAYVPPTQTTLTGPITLQSNSSGFVARV